MKLQSKKNAVFYPLILSGADAEAVLENTYDIVCLFYKKHIHPSDKACLHIFYSLMRSLTRVPQSC